jgi:hypothetical protein
MAGFIEGVDRGVGLAVSRLNVAHRAHVGAPKLTQEAICSGTPAESGVGKNLLCTALLAYPRTT